jgi:hypothetical protein
MAGEVSFHSPDTHKWRYQNGLITYYLVYSIEYINFLCFFNAGLLFFYYLVYEAIGTAATHGLLCQPRVIMKMIVEKRMECRLAGETEILGENLPQRHFCPSQNPTWLDPGLNPGRRGGKPTTNRLSYGAVSEETLNSAEYSLDNTKIWLIWTRLKYYVGNCSLP